MNPEWITGRLAQSMKGFAPPMQIPSYSGAKNIPTFKGIDFSTGKTVELNKYFDAPSFSVSPLPGSPQDGAALPGIDPRTAAYADFYRATSPQRIAEMEAAANVSANLSERQLRQLYPYLSAAGAESTARNLAASQAYRAFTEQLPSNIQNIMASKQQQMATAAGSEAALQQATAMQQDAATRFPGRFAGQYVSFG
jgi:hypothetical protein